MNSQAYEWITLERQLPPTECPLVILVPAGTEYPWLPGLTATSEVDQVLTVQRKDHVDNKESDITYWLLDDKRRLTEMNVVGRMPWSYP